MGSPTVLACADLGSHVVDLWEEPGAELPWCCGNDDRSVVGRGASADEALDAYVAGLGFARELLDDEEDGAPPCGVRHEAFDVACTLGAGHEPPHCPIHTGRRCPCATDEERGAPAASTAAEEPAEAQPPPPVSWGALSGRVAALFGLAADQVDAAREELRAHLGRHPEVRAELSALLAPREPFLPEQLEELARASFAQPRPAGSKLPHCWIGPDGAPAGWWRRFDPGCLTCHARRAQALGLAADQVDAAREELRAETAAEQASTAPEKG